MKKSYKFSTIFGTLYLVVYTLLIRFEASFNTIAVMFLLSPFLVIWMAYNILKYGKFNGRELQENEEWGYSERSHEHFEKRY
jgi:hypothetical protein